MCVCVHLCVHLCASVCVCVCCYPPAQVFQAAQHHPDDLGVRVLWALLVRHGVVVGGGLFIQHVLGDAALQEGKESLGLAGRRLLRNTRKTLIPALVRRTFIPALGRRPLRKHTGANTKNCSACMPIKWKHTGGGNTQLLITARVCQYNGSNYSQLRCLYNTPYDASGVGKVNSYLGVI
jgi:hypothetical protein